MEPVASKSERRLSASLHRHQAGYLLVAVQVFIAASFVAAASVYQGLHHTLQLERSGTQVTSSESGFEHALGVGLARLLTGQPPEGDYVCRLRLLDDGSGEPANFDLHYTSTSAGSWRVRAAAGAGDTQECPYFFSTSCPVQGS